MRKILLINAIIELTAGIIVILSPDLLLYNTPMDNLSFNISKMYGIAAATIGLFSYLLYNHAQSAQLVKFSCLTIIAFHVILAFHLYGMYTMAMITHPGPMAFHLLVFLVLGILYLRDNK